MKLKYKPVGTGDSVNRSKVDGSRQNVSKFPPEIGNEILEGYRVGPSALDHKTDALDPKPHRKSGGSGQPWRRRGSGGGVGELGFGV